MLPDKSSNSVIHNMNKIYAFQIGTHIYGRYGRSRCN